MAKIKIERPTETTFGKLNAGALFETQGHIYIKAEHDSDKATAVHKNGGLMNAGEIETFKPDRVVHYVTEAIFKVG